MRFVKMQGLGNDFVMLNGFALPEVESSNFGVLAQHLCDRHFGIGADGLIAMVPSPNADARMIYYNSDGTPAEMCGNGLRCAARFLLDENLCDKDDLIIETGAGLLSIQVKETGITANMGLPTLEPACIPVLSDSNCVSITVDGTTYDFFCVSMGNPHAVTFTKFPDQETFLKIAPQLETHPFFPARANIEFVRVEESGLRVLVWERGDGPTLACGTGACAVLTAAHALKLCGNESDVFLPGGRLHIRIADDGSLLMTGPTIKVFEGDI